MKILHLEPKPIVEFDFLNAGRRPNQFFVDKLPVFLGQVDRLPSGVDAMVVTADLQGREVFPNRKSGDQLRLLGEVLPSMLLPTLDSIGIEPGQKIGAVLAGDFYTYPDLHGRGGTGDVTPVWHAFSDQYHWVIGVAGNHDTFGSSERMSNSRANIHFLDNERFMLADLKIAGLSGVIGNPRKNFRRTHDEFLRALEQLTAEPTDILIMHDGPDGGMPQFRGIHEARDIIEFTQPKLVIRGHSHWPKPLVELDNKVQVLNVDATVVILTQ
jgi:Icc-related predicted phosphoesterase